MGDQFGRHAELLGERVAEDHGDAAIVAGLVLDGELRGRRRRDGDGDAQFSSGGELSGRIGHCNELHVYFVAIWQPAPRLPSDGCA